MPSMNNGKFCTKCGGKLIEHVEQEKTVEVRKNYPKDINWDKTVKLYCSKDKKSFNQIPKRYQPLMELVLGKVIGEFVCDKIIDIDYGVEEGVYLDGDFQEGFEKNGEGNNPTCLSFVDLEKYLTANEGYGWHISSLVVYDKPRELGEFITPTACKSKVAKDMLCNTCCLSSGFCSKKPKRITRPPQSWCYVESEVEGE